MALADVDPWTVTSIRTPAPLVPKPAPLQAQPAPEQSPTDWLGTANSFLSSIGMQSPQAAPAPQPAAPSFSLPDTNELTVGTPAQQAPPEQSSGGGGFFGGLKHLAGDALHTGLTAVNDVLSPVAKAGEAGFANLSGETSAGRHPILDANGQPTGQFYRDKPDFGDVLNSVKKLGEHPIAALQSGPQAFQERLQNPAQNAVTRGVLEAGSNPLTYAFGPEGAAVGGGLAVGGEALNENAAKIPGYNLLTPDEQQALQLIVPLVGAKFAPQIIDAVKGGATTAADALTTGALSGERGSIELGPQPPEPPIGDLNGAGEIAPSPEPPPLIEEGDQTVETPTPIESPAPQPGVNAAGESATPLAAPPAAGEPPPPVAPAPPQPTPPEPGQPQIPDYRNADILNLPDIQPTPLTKKDILFNAIKNTMLGDRAIPEDTIATPAMRAREVLKPQVASQAARVGAQVDAIARDAFQTDANGRITNITGNPTIQDVAARLDSFRPFLSPAQLNALAQIQKLVSPYGALLDKVGVEFGSRADVEPGGFYLPRGRADIEGADSPKVGTGRGGAGNRRGFEKAATFDSMTQGLDAGYQYAPFAEAVKSYAQDAGTRAVDQHVASYFKALTDDEGNPLGETAAARVPEVLRNKWTAANARLASLKGRLETAEKRAGVATGGAEELSTPLEKLRAGAGDKTATREAIAQARKELRSAQSDALAASRQAGGAAQADRTTNAAFKAAQARAEAAMARLQDARKTTAGLNEITQPGVRLPALPDSAVVERAVNDASLSTKELRDLAAKVKMPVNAQDASNASMLRRGTAEIGAKASIGDLRDATNTALEAAKVAAPEEVHTAIRAMERRVTLLRNRGTQYSGLADSIGHSLDAAKRNVSELAPEWRAALEKARATPREQGSIGFSQLQGTTFPDAIANVANKYLRDEKTASGKGAVAVHAVNAVNNLMRGLRASADVSFMGIQGLLGAVHDPVGYGKALAVSYKALSDPLAEGKYLNEFDQKAAAVGKPDSQAWAANGVHLNGADTEFAIKGNGLLGGLGASVAKLPIVRQSNRMFGYFGDSMRLELADTMYDTVKAQGHDMTNPGTLMAIADVANKMTGWTQGTFGGSLGQLGEFAPRFLQSQLDLITKAATDGGIGGQQARLALVKLVGIGTILTVAANEASSRPIPYKDLLNPGNSNFMRIRIAGNDVSLFGPWDSLVKNVISLSPVSGSGVKRLATSGDLSGVLRKPDVAYGLRSKASPTVSTAWDLITGKTFTGQDASLTNPDYVLRSILPFSVQDIGNVSPVTTGVGLTGLKASPLTPTEQLSQISQAQFGKDFYSLQPKDQQTIKDAHPDIWQAAISRGSAQRQQYNQEKATLAAQQAASDAALQAGTIDARTWLDQYQTRNTQITAYGNALYPGQKNPGKTPVDAYYKLVDDNTGPDGAVNYTAVDRGVAAMSAADQQYIADNTGVNGTPMVKAYRQAANLYYGTPKYRGYDANTGSAIDSIVRTAKATLGPKASAGRLLGAVTQLGQQQGLTPTEIAGARKSVLGVLATSPQRARLMKTNPWVALFFGSAGPTLAQRSQLGASLVQGAA